MYSVNQKVTPIRTQDHQIPLLWNAKTVNSRGCRYLHMQGCGYLHMQKNVIESIVKEMMARWECVWIIAVKSNNYKKIIIQYL